MPLLISVAVIIPGGLYGTIWWEERPLRQATTLLEADDPSGALKLVNGFLRDHPEHGHAGTLRGRIFVALGRWIEGVAEFERCGAATTDELHSLSVALLHLEQWTHALPILELVEESRPTDPDVLHELSGCQAKLGQYTAALDSAEKFAAIDGYRERGLLLIGTIQRESGNESKALDAWQQLAELNPEAEGLQLPPYEFLREYGYVLLQQGQPKQAVDALRKSLTLMADSESEAFLGDALLQTGDSDAAGAAWDRAVDLNPGNVSAREALARQALRTREPDVALEWLMPLKQLSTLRSSTAYLFQRAYAQAGDDQKAAEWKTRHQEVTRVELRDSAINHLLIESPDSWWAQVIRAWQMADAQNWAEAEAVVTPLLSGEDRSDPFLRDLVEAIRNRTAPPSLDRIPVQQL